MARSMERTGTSCPPLSMTLSKTIPSRDSGFSLVKACASVTCPISFESRWATILPWATTSATRCAVTGSPAFAFLASSVLDNSAYMIAPFSRPAGDGPAGSAGCCAWRTIAMLLRPSNPASTAACKSFFMFASGTKTLLHVKLDLDRGLHLHRLTLQQIRPVFPLLDGFYGCCSQNGIALHNL